MIPFGGKIKTLSEIYRVLKPEGRYITAEFTKFTPKNLLITHNSLIHKISLFSPDLLEKNGFRILERMEIARGVMVISAEKPMGVV